ncbi:MAG: class I SAM-dependent methyltransferase [Synergistaceae bacterium]|nr:class I SAM-dependent methyltransferase [Synergistaceae bacterium]
MAALEDMSITWQKIITMCYVSWTMIRQNTQGGGGVLGLEVRSPEILKSLDDVVVILGTSMGFDEVSEQLKNLGIPEHRINKTFVQILMQARILFLQRFAERVYKENICGSVAEAGVYKGDFAKHINKNFPDRKCYLFDTFDGFTDYDISREQKESMTSADYMKNVNISEVLAKMPNQDNIILKVGRFPDTAQGINDSFAFVNLDMDLYEPTLQGLRFFYPLMSNGGIILIHDYFSDAYPNVEQAVKDFEFELGAKLHKMPIGDNISLAIIK